MTTHTLIGWPRGLLKGLVVPRMIVVGALAGLVLIGCALVNRPSAGLDPPVYQPGAAYIFSDGRVERVVSSNDEVTVWATRRGRQYTKSNNPAIPVLEWTLSGRSGSRAVFGAHHRLWPVRSGAEARFRVRTDFTNEGRTARSVQLWHCRVGQAETVTLAVGPFETLPVRCERYSVNTMAVLEQRTWWWSPEVGHYVRRSLRNLRTGRRRDMVLCAALPPQRANQDRIDDLARQRC